MTLQEVVNKTVTLTTNAVVPKKKKKKKKLSN
jgi:hypothetical protein